MAAPRIRVIPFAEQPVMPWANGGGSTRQVAIDPPDGSLQRGFRWRVSCAQVASDGPFSRLPGVDRSLWLVRGNGMRIQIADREIVLERASQRVDFRGEDDARASLLDGPCEDCNVMSTRGAVVADSRVLSSPGGETLVTHCDGQALLLVLSGSLRLVDQAIVLCRGDAAQWEGSGRIEFVVPEPACVLSASFR